MFRDVPDITGCLGCAFRAANEFVHGIREEYWKELIENKKKPLINKSFAGLYPPGSTIKPIVALSALENDVISPKTTGECRGKVELYGHTYHCWKEKGHGFVNLREAVKQSCGTDVANAEKRPRWDSVRH